MKAFFCRWAFTARSMPLSISAMKPVEVAAAGAVGGLRQVDGDVLEAAEAHATPGA